MVQEKNATRNLTYLLFDSGLVLVWFYYQANLSWDLLSTVQRDTYTHTHTAHTQRGFPLN